MTESDDIIPLTLGEFMLAMLQGKYNRENPEHRCECKSIEEMARLHFDIHKENKK